MSETRHATHHPSMRFFISHSPADTTLARKLRNLLFERMNARVFLDEDLGAHENWRPRLRRELNAADAVVALLTPDSVGSNRVLHEIGAAWGIEKTIIPVITRRDVLNRIPVPLNARAAVDLGDLENQKSADRFVKAFEDSLPAASAA